MPFTAAWMDPEIPILSEMSQIKTNIMLYVDSGKMIPKNLFAKQK